MEVLVFIRDCMDSVNRRTLCQQEQEARNLEESRESSR